MTAYTDDDVTLTLFGVPLICENYTTGDCTTDHGRSITSPYGATGYCWPCRIRVAAPAIAARAAADALVAFADAHRMPFVMFRREDGSAVTVSDLLREESARLRGRAEQVNP